MKKVLSKIMASVLTLSLLMSYLPAVSIKAEMPETPDSKHTVIFTDKNGTALVTQSIADGDPCVLPDVPDEEGYAFTEWKKVTNGSESTLTSVKDDVTFQATYRKLESRKLIIHYYLKDSTEKLAEDYIGEFYAGEEVNLHIQSPIVMGDTGASFDYESYFDYVGNIDDIGSYEQVIEYELQSGSSYIVRFWKQKADTNEYELDGSVSVAGQTPGLYSEAASYAPADKYVGFTLQPIAEEVISCDNSTIVDVYYDRDSYVLTFDSQSGTYVNSGVVRQGTRLGSLIPNASSMVRNGYTFNGWKDSNGTTYTAASTMPTHDLHLIAQWTANRTATYTVMYWQEKAPTVESQWTTDANYLTNPEKYDCVESLTHTARNVGNTPVYDNRNYQGFTFQGAVTPVIQPDGSTVVNVYYKRNVVTITLQKKQYRDDVTWATITAKQGTYIAEKWNEYQSANRMYSRNTYSGNEYSLQAYMPLEGFTVYTTARASATQYVVYIVETIENPNQYKVYYELNTSMKQGLTSVREDVATINGFGGNNSNSTATIRFKNWIGLSTLRTFTGSSIGLVDANANRTYTRSCWISYERLSYPVSFYSGNTKVDEVGVRFEAVLNHTYNYASGISTPANVEAYANALGQTLTVPANVEPDYVFAGWYLDQEGTVPFDWSISMPTSEVKAYAKWAPPTYTLKWHMNENDIADELIEVAGETENVLPKYTLITGSLVPADPSTTKGTYTDPKDGTVYPAADFLGWYLDPECTQPFIDGMQITRDTDIYAKWYDRTHLSYTVYMIDEAGETVVVDGEEVEPETYIGQYNGLAEIPEFDNYTLITNSDMLLVTDDGQKIIILYRRNSNWHLKREFVDSEGNTIAAADDEVLAGEQRIANFETISGYKLVGVKINGVAATGNDAPERVIVTKDKAGNAANTAVVTFVYEPIPPIEYKVEYYLQDETDGSSFVKKADATITGRSAKQGQSVALEEGDEKTFDGYALIPDDARNVRELVLDRNADGEPVLKLYYRSLSVLQPTSVTFSGTKTLTGFPTGSSVEPVFTFTLSEGNEVLDTQNVTKSGTFTFEAITYEEEGEHTYTIAENAGQLGGITYDTTVYTVKVTVADDGTGQLVATITGVNADGSGADFENTYTASPAEVTFSGIKTITGRDLKAEEFSFTLTGNEDNVSETVKNAANGAITFSKITYTKAGTYTYTIAENDTQLGGVTKDSKVYNITVTVTDNGNGQLVAAITGVNADGTGVNFSNLYTASPAEVTFSGIKTITGRDLKAEEFSFTLTGNEDNVSETVKNAANGAITFSKITYTKAGTYTYTIAENDTQLGGVTKDSKVYNITVTVADNGNGQLVATITGVNADGTGADFENTYTASPAEVTFSGTKTFTGFPENSLLAPVFTFTVSENGVVIDTQYVTMNGSFTFGAISYDEEGEHIYTIAEVDDKQGGITFDTTVYTVKVTVTDNGEGQLVALVTDENENPIAADKFDFTNTYTAAAAEVTFTGIKTMIGRELAAEEFSFTVIGNEDGVNETVKNAADGAIAFSKIVYEKVGTYTYTVAEDDTDAVAVSKDRTVYEITVTVTDPGTGKLSAAITGIEADGSGLNFENTYHKGSLEIKTAVDGDLADPAKEFTYTIIIDAEGEFSYSGSKTGTIKSGDTIQLKDGESIIIEDLPAGTTYTVTESDYDDYIVTYTGDTGTIPDGETAVADFLNVRNSLPHTGADYALSICMSIMGTLSMAGAVLCRKKREDEE